MKTNSLLLAINAVLVIAVAVLFYLHFAQKPAAAPVVAKTAAVTAASDSASISPEDTTAAAPAAVAAAPEPVKIGYVESSKLLDGYKGMQVARRNFEAKAKGWEQQNKTMITNFQSAVQKYQAQAASLTPEQRAATEQQLQQQEQKVGQEQQKLQRQAAEEEAKMSQQVLTRVNKLIEQYGKENGYQFILIAQPGGSIAYSRKDLDVTAPVLKRLNTEYGKK
ncbi:OmpH family outer membrane protein [Hymenobacter sp. HDW8]|uniref:OmpH family outer membrane protein n=1 Tax=Hymenobacter sp. HDW8 TaxID=2714932 RepID=UPI00140B54CB|nr:OmpH family outer membrane protein [Hymenobacter sp. HDW8]QIL77122.1 OmpH family outer membrane protein [Hymenobacter sp. HDW8]